MRKPTILCVDDDLNHLTGRESLLRLHGYDVVVTTSGWQSLKVAMQWSWGSPFQVAVGRYTARSRLASMPR
jgi:CheY-like chemotaxis protein